MASSNWAPRLPSPRERSERCGGVGGGGQRCAERLSNHFKHAVDVLHDVVVPKSENSVAVGPQIRISLNIACGVRLLAMLAAIQLNHQPPRVACKGGEVRPNRCLSSKMRAIGFETATALPQPSFGIGHVATKPPRPRHSLISRMRQAHRSISAPHPDPSPPLRGGWGAERPCLPNVQTDVSTITPPPAAAAASCGCRRRSASCPTVCRRRTRPLPSPQP